MTTVNVWGVCFYFRVFDTGAKYGNHQSYKITALTLILTSETTYGPHNLKFQILMVE
jgi:hypothetical protein